MKKNFVKLVSWILALCMVLPLAGCGGGETKEYDVPALAKSILSQVTFADTLSSVGDAAALYFPDMPEGARIELHIGSGYYADEVALITLAGDKDMASAKKSVEAHLDQLHDQFANYIPAELGKIKNAYVWENGKYILVCITDDMASVKDILNHAGDPSYKVPGRPVSNTTQPPQTTVPPTSQPNQTTQPGETTKPTENTVPPTTPPTTPPVVTTPPTTAPVVTTPPVTQSPVTQYRPDGYPAIQSQSGTYSAYSGSSMIRVDNRAFEVCGYSDSTAATYAARVSKVADQLAGKTTVYSLAIPTSFGIMLPDDIQAIYPNYINQGESIEKVLSKMSSNVVPVRCFDNLMSHRNEYLYFRTDHHWNGIGAYYAYEAFCEAKGIQPYTMQQREEKQFGNFLGTLYINTGKDANLLPADTVYAYKPYSKTATMVFYDKKGTEVKWSIIADVTNWDAGGKYNTFAGADNPLAIFTNPEVTDGSVCIVVKESYGNALLPYLVDHYSTVYEIDYRYWSGDLAAYAQEVGADDLVFANNIMMISTNLLVGNLSKIIK